MYVEVGLWKGVVEGGCGGEGIEKGVWRGLRTGLWRGCREGVL